MAEKSVKKPTVIGKIRKSTKKVQKTQEPKTQEPKEN